MPISISLKHETVKQRGFPFRCVAEKRCIDIFTKWDH